VIEVIVEFIVEALDILEWRNNLLQVVVLKSYANDKAKVVAELGTRSLAHLLLAEYWIINLGMRLAWTHNNSQRTARVRAYHYPINSIVCISLDDRYLDAVTILTTPIVSSTLTERRANLAELKLDAQCSALLASKLGIGPTGRIRGGENADELRWPRARDIRQTRFHFGEEGLGNGFCFEENTFGRWCRRWV
jgi:hypothetical protein